MRTSISPVASAGLTVSGVRRTTSPVTVMTLSGRTAVASANADAPSIDDALGDAIMVAQIDEQQVAVIALAVHPAGQADFCAGIGEAQSAASVRAIGMHGLNLDRIVAAQSVRWRAPG